MPRRIGSRRGARAARGFTLLEVLVALAVLSVALGAALKGAAETAANAVYLTRKTEAHWVAVNKVVELQLLKNWPSVGTSEGVTEMGGNAWHWTANVRPTPDKDIRRVEVGVRPSHEDQPIQGLATGFVPNPQ